VVIFAATNYLKQKTTEPLTNAFRPVIEKSLQKVNATKYWSDVFTAYNKFATNKINPDLTAYVTGKALDGIFYQVGLEEQKIRKDPVARVSEILKKSVWKQTGARVDRGGCRVRSFGFRVSGS